jgi:hypothetical protein
MFAERAIKELALSLLASLALSLAIAGCSKPPITLPVAPTGMASWDEVQSYTEAFYLHGKTAGMFAHVDLFGVPPTTLQAFTNVLQDWHSPPDGFKVVSTNVMTPAEYEASQQEFWKDFPPEMRQSHLKWNFTPEKIIVFTFASTEPGHENDQLQRTTGAFRTNGLWYFAASYQ